MSVVWLLSAVRDLRELRNYIAEHDPGSAAVVVARIWSAVKTLESFPYTGRVGRELGSRELVVPRTPYFVVYRVKELDVEIYRIRHGAQRWPPR